mmetsp:Transcript_22547/g.58860  ORF Transcript_22547/g.58860 Transcript_22547/m.58860 type:complete len:566 (-) Transcript_22547:234-1931(-)
MSLQVPLSRGSGREWSPDSSPTAPSYRTRGESDSARTLHPKSASFVSGEIHPVDGTFRLVQRDENPTAKRNALREHLAAVVATDSAAGALGAFTRVCESDPGAVRWSVPLGDVQSVARLRDAIAGHLHTEARRRWAAQLAIMSAASDDSERDAPEAEVFVQATVGIAAALEACCQLPMRWRAASGSGRRERAAEGHGAEADGGDGERGGQDAPGAWLRDTVVAGAVDALGRLLASETADLEKDAELRRSYRDNATRALRHDMVIYDQQYIRTTVKEKRVTAELLARLGADAAAVRKRWPTASRPLHRGLAADGTVWDVLQHAAEAKHHFELYTAKLELLTPYARVHVGAGLKSAFRIAQKAWLRGSAASICDVSRALARVGTVAGMAKLHALLMKQDAAGEIELIEVKDRLSTPTDGGWRDVVYLVRIPSDPTGHIHEIQLVLGSLFKARQSLEGHRAYSMVRHQKEVVEQVLERLEASKSRRRLTGTAWKWAQSDGDGDRGLRGAAPQDSGVARSGDGGNWVATTLVSSISGRALVAAAVATAAAVLAWGPSVMSGPLADAPAE